MKIGYFLILFILVLIIGVYFIFKMKSEDFNRAAGFNLLVITLDTTRADRSGAYGCTEAKTPYLDQTTRQGIMFENCYAPVPLTFPAHCSLFTGKYPIGHRARTNGNYILTGDEKTPDRDIESTIWGYI